MTELMLGLLQNGLEVEHDPPPDPSEYGYKISDVAETRVEKEILKQIAFWYPKAKTVRCGHIWLIKTAEEFRAHGVEYACDTIWRAIRSLVKREVLVTERHWHPYKQSRGPVLWIRPTMPIINDKSAKKKKAHLCAE